MRSITSPWAYEADQLPAIVQRDSTVRAAGQYEHVLSPYNNEARNAPFMAEDYNYYPVGRNTVQPFEQGEQLQAVDVDEAMRRAGTMHLGRASGTLGRTYRMGGGTRSGALSKSARRLGALGEVSADCADWGSFLQDQTSRDAFVAYLLSGRQGGVAEFDDQRGLTCLVQSGFGGDMSSAQQAAEAYVPELVGAGLLKDPATLSGTDKVANAIAALFLVSFMSMGYSISDMQELKSVGERMNAEGKWGSYRTEFAEVREQSKPWYKKPLYVGAAALGVLGVAFAATR